MTGSAAPAAPRCPFADGGVLPFPPGNGRYDAPQESLNNLKTSPGTDCLFTGTVIPFHYGEAARAACLAADDAAAIACDPASCNPSEGDVDLSLLYVGNAHGFSAEEIFGGSEGGPSEVPGGMPERGSGENRRAYLGLRRIPAIEGQTQIGVKGLSTDGQEVVIHE